MPHPSSRIPRGLACSTRAAPSALEQQNVGMQKMCEPATDIDRCSLCELHRQAVRAEVPEPKDAEDAEHTEDARTIAYVDLDVLAVVDTATLGVRIIPRAHTGSTTAAPPALLAALRAAVLDAQEAYAARDATIELSAGISGARGHASYYVRPVTVGASPREPDDLLHQTRRLAALVRGRASALATK